MNIFFLNSSFERSAVVDQYESFIWAERYASAGDFEMVLPYSLRNRVLFSVGKMLAQTESDRVMVIETVLVEEEESGAVKMTVRGPSMEMAILGTRVLTRVGFDGAGTWQATGTLGNIIRLMVARSLVPATAQVAADAFPTLYATDSSGTTESVTVATKAQYMYSAVKELCDSDDLGFRVQLMKANLALRFNVYKGATRNSIIFSSSMDNLSEESTLVSNASHKNIAYVWAKDATAPQIFAAPGVSVNVAGFARRVMHIDASDIDMTGKTAAQVTQLLRRRAMQELGANKALNLFDGKLTGTSRAAYNVDYYLGDVVFTMDENQQKRPVRVTEYIWTHDAEGIRSYPTLTAVD